jgi:ribosomal protein L7/L12
MTLEQILQEVDKLTIEEIRQLYYTLCERLGPSETGVVTGKYAQEIREELKRKPAPEEKKAMEERIEFFRNIPRR